MVEKEKEMTNNGMGFLLLMKEEPTEAKVVHREKVLKNYMTERLHKLSDG